MDVKELGKYAKQIVFDVGQLLRIKRKTSLNLTEKKDHSDLVTEMDMFVEKNLVENILKCYPSHGILGEEGIFEGNSSEYETVWIIDPIDGTTNFIHNFPYYGISVAVVHKGEPLIGVVYNPSTDELFFAEKNKGAFVNGNKLEIKGEMKLKEALISTTMFYTDLKTKESVHKSLITLTKKARAIRMVGGAAISLCELAKGTLNAYVMPMLNTWDYAGGIIILKEAGGVVTKLNGEEVSLKENGSLLAADPSIHEEILAIFKNDKEFK